MIDGNVRQAAWLYSYCSDGFASKTIIFRRMAFHWQGASFTLAAGDFFCTELVLLLGRLLLISSAAAQDPFQLSEVPVWNREGENMICLKCRSKWWVLQVQTLCCTSLRFTKFAIEIRSPAWGKICGACSFLDPRVVPWATLFLGAAYRKRLAYWQLRWRISGRSAADGDGIGIRGSGWHGPRVWRSWLNAGSGGDGHWPNGWSDGPNGPNGPGRPDGYGWYGRHGWDGWDGGHGWDGWHGSNGNGADGNGADGDGRWTDGYGWRNGYGWRTDGYGPNAWAGGKPNGWVRWFTWLRWLSTGKHHEHGWTASNGWTTGLNGSWRESVPNAQALMRYPAESDTQRTVLVWGLDHLLVWPSSRVRRDKALHLSAKQMSSFVAQSWRCLNLLTRGEIQQQQQETL